MAYSQSGLIEATDYNNRATNINNIWGTGSGSNGYGQTSTILVTNKANTDLVSATEWASLVNRLESITQHQTAVTSGISAPTSGSTVTFLSTLDTKLAAIITNKLSVGSRGTTATPGVQMTSATAWTTSAIKEFSVTFGDINMVRYWFNAGGLLNSYCSVISPTTTKASDWNTFLTNQVGTITLGSNFCSRSGTGGDTLTLNTSVGYYSLTTTYQTLFNIGSTSVTADYGNNYATIEAKIGGALGTTNSNIVYIKFTLYDTAGDIVLDTVSGITLCYTGVTNPETTYLTQSWGTPTFTTVTNTQS